LIDLHCHILPGLDDGSSSLDESLAMARLAVAAGITTVVCTPHQFDGRYDNPRAKILAAVDALRAELGRAAIPLEVRPGGEVHLHPELLDRVDSGEAMTPGGTILLELPHHAIPPGTAETIFALQLKKLTVVLAHPERNRGILRKPGFADELAARGVILQITEDSLQGEFGPEVRKLGERLLAKHASAVTATDAHRAQGHRIPRALSRAATVPR